MNRTIISRILQVLLVVVVVAIVLLVVSRFPTTDIPVLTQPVAAGEKITAADIGHAQVPSNFLFSSIVTADDQLIDKTAAVDIAAKEPIKLSELGTPRGTIKGGDPKFPFANAADVDKLYVWVPVDLARSSGNVVSPGDYVDVLFVSEGRSQFVLQKVHVVAMRTADGHDISALPGGDNPTGPGVLPAGAILALTKAQAELVTALPPAALNLIWTRVDAPDLPGVPTGASGDGGTSPLASPSPIVGPTPTPAVSPTTAPSESPSASGSATPSASGSVVPSASTP